MWPVVVSLGSNIERETNLRIAVTHLRTFYPGISFSPVFKSDAVGFNGPYFLNLVGVFDSDHPAHMLVEQLHDVEACQGRQRTQDSLTSRPIDIDLLLYGDSVLYDQGMDVPRREILKYAHVLKPLSLALPDTCHPVSGRSYHELWRAMSVCQEKLLELTDLEL